MKYHVSYYSYVYNNTLLLLRPTGRATPNEMPSYVRIVMILRDTLRFGSLRWVCGQGTIIKGYVST